MSASHDRVPLVRTAEEQAEEDAFLSLYGDWKPLAPAEVAAELDGLPCPWWIVGGWAIEAATGYQREHDDTDISILSGDVPTFVEHLRDRWHIWNNVGGVLHPLGDRWPDVEEPQSQLWLRASAASSWCTRPHSVVRRTTPTSTQRCRFSPLSAGLGCATR